MADSILQGIEPEWFAPEQVGTPRTELQPVQSSPDVPWGSGNFPFQANETQGELPAARLGTETNGTPGVDDYSPESQPERGVLEKITDYFTSQEWDETSEKIGNRLLKISAGLGNENSLRMLATKQANTAAGAAAKAILGASDKHARGDSDGAMMDIQQALSDPKVRSRLDAANTKMLLQAYQGIAKEKGEYGEFQKAVDAMNAADPQDRMAVATALRDVRSPSVRKELEGMIALKSQNTNTQFQWDPDSGVMMAFDKTTGAPIAYNQMREPKEKTERSKALAASYDAIRQEGWPDFATNAKLAAKNDPEATKRQARAAVYQREAPRIAKLRDEIEAEGLDFPEGVASTTEVPGSLKAEARKRRDKREVGKVATTAITLNPILADRAAQTTVSKAMAEAGLPASNVKNPLVGQGQVYYVDASGKVRPATTEEKNRPGTDLLVDNAVGIDENGNIKAGYGAVRSPIDVRAVNRIQADKPIVEGLRRVVKKVLTDEKWPPGTTLAQAGVLWAQRHTGDKDAQYLDFLTNVQANSLARIETGSSQGITAMAENIRAHQTNLANATKQSAIQILDTMDTMLDNVALSALGLPPQNFRGPTVDGKSGRVWNR